MCGKIWRYLDPRTTLHCKSGITLAVITSACPELSSINTCVLTDYDKDVTGKVCETSEFYRNPQALYASNALIISFVPGELAVYSMEGFVALCFRKKEFNGILATLPQFKNIVDKSWDIRWGY